MNNDNAIINRVPHIILLYWIIKIASTTLGETGADMFSMTFNIGYGYTIVIFMALFLVSLGVKLAMKRYETISYWFLFTMTAIVGTAISDYIDRTLKMGYAAGSALLLTLLLVVLGVWYKTEKSIDVEKITTTRAELFYWMAFLVANTLGTAAGDYLSDNLEMGFMFSAALIAVVLVITALLHFYTKMSGILLFWIAFVLTRPFGATFGDLLTKTHEKGGLDLGTIGSSIFFAIVLVIALLREIHVEKSKVVKDFAL
ncbi:MAG: hypothetical protein H7177_17000 [Rhizobacter sp.]|nr:hypothetical protein [Bacteriovorax sp.]